jgi:hypothetical protein
MFGSHDARGSARPAFGVVTIAVLTGVSLLYLTLSMQRSIIVYDEGLILFGAERVLHGDVPHRDFYANYGPAQFYLLAGLYKLFGASVLVERALDTVERCCCVVLVFAIVDRAAPRVHAILAAGASLIWLQYFGAYGYPLFPALAAALAGLACLMPSFRGSGTSSRLLAAGGCAGVVLLFRYDTGIATFLAECALLALIPVTNDPQAAATGGGRRSAHALEAWSQPAGLGSYLTVSFRCGLRANRMRTITERLLLFSLGFLAVTLPVAAVFAWYGVIPDLVFDIFTTAGNYARMRAMPFPRLNALWTNPGETGVYVPLVLCMAALPAIVARLRHRWPATPVTKHREGALSGTAPSPWTLLVLLVMTLVFYTKGLVHVSALFMSMGLIISLMLAGVLAQPVPGRGRLDSGIVMTAVVMTAAATLYNVPNALHQAWWNIDWARDPASWDIPLTEVPPPLGSCRMPPELERIACFKVQPDLAETVRYIQQRTEPQDPVFVGLSGHDRIFGNNMLIYFVLNRPSATKWHHFDPGLQTSAPIQRLMINELRGARPSLIVLVKWGELTDPNESSLSSGVTLLDDYIRHAYEPVATFGANTILRMRTS